MDLIEKELFPVGNGFGRNCIVFIVDMSSSVHIDNKKRDIFILGEGPTQGLDVTALTAGEMYSFSFTETRRKFC